MDRTKLNILLQKSKQNSLNANLIVWEKIMKNKKTFQLQKPKKLQHLIKMGKKLQETHLKKIQFIDSSRFISSDKKVIRYCYHKEDSDEGYFPEIDVQYPEKMT